MPGAVGGPKLSKRVYMSLTVGAPAPKELLEWQLAERFGWTLNYIRSLTMQDLQNLFQIDDGRNKARPRQK